MIQNHRTLLAGVSLGFFLGASAVAVGFQLASRLSLPAQQATEVVRTKRLELVDEKGKVCGAFAHKEGQTIFIILGADDTPEIFISGGTSKLGVRSPFIGIANASEMTGLEFRADEKASIRLMGKKDKQKRIEQ